MDTALQNVCYSNESYNILPKCICRLYAEHLKIDTQIH